MATRKADRPLQRYIESARPASFATVDLHHQPGHDQTALRYARELAVGSNAAARVLGKLRQEAS